MSSDLPAFPPDAKLRIAKLFSSSGMLYKSYGMHPRQSQLNMVNTICNAWVQNKGTLVEAATGTGKTFGYLLPAAEFIVHRRVHEGTPRVVISTASKNLQDQLSIKDLPIIQAIYPDIKFFDWKGATNYLCVNRLHKIITKKSGSVNPEVLLEAHKLWQYKAELSHLPSGRRDDLPIPISDSLWFEICGAAPCCTSQGGFTCYKRNAYFKAKEADILVLNHTFLAYMALYADMLHPSRPAPEDTLLIFDEGHEITNQVRNAINHDFNVNFLFSVIKRMDHPKKEGYHHQLQGICDAFAPHLGEEPVKISPQTKLLVSLLTNLGVLMNEMATTLQGMQKNQGKHEMFTTEEDMDQSKEAYASLFRNSALLLDYITKFPADRMLELTTDPANPRRVRISFFPFTYANELQHIYAFSTLPPVITSATLLGGDSSQLLKRYALPENAVTVSRVTGEFNYEDTVRGFCFPEFPNVSDPHLVAHWLKHILPMSHGNALVLFTNYSVMNEAFLQVSTWGQQRGYNMLLQESQQPIQDLIKSMRTTENTVLFGNAALWTGIDIKGTHLSSLIITKLPFMPLNNFAEAYSAYLSLQGGHPFYDWMLPEMIIRFRQGIGRLKRDELDKGLLFILDPRLVKAKYKNSVIGRLPIMDWHQIYSEKDLPSADQTANWLNVSPPINALPFSDETVELDDEDPF
jgi:ATP-dependent DNA helicase DinG